MIKKKRVLIIENGAGYGGSVTSIVSFLHCLDKDKYFPIFLHSSTDERLLTLKESFATICLPMPYSCRKKSAGRKRKHLIEMLLSLKSYVTCEMFYSLKLITVIIKEKIDIVYLNNGINANLSGILAAKMTRRPSLIHERDVLSWVSPVAQLCSRWVNAYIAISNVCSTALVQADIPKEKITIIHEGLNLELFDKNNFCNHAALKEEFGITESSLVVVMAGSIIPWKGHEIVLKAINKVSQENLNIKLLCVGKLEDSDRSYFYELQKYVSDNGLEENITFTDFRWDVLGLLDMADVVVHASTSPEPFGRVIIEAMALGKPVISNTIGAPVEIIEDSVTGFLVPPNDPEALSHKILSLINCGDLMKVVGENAREEVFMNYGIGVHTEAIEEVLSSFDL